MNRKKIMPLLLALTLGASSLLYGCGNDDGDATNDNATNNVQESVKERADDAKDNVKNSAEDAGDKVKSLWDNVTDTSMDYTTADLESNLKANNINPEKVDRDHSLFSDVDSDSYKLNDDQVVDVYQYGITDNERMSKDLSSLSADGMTMNGKEVKWNTGAHIYKKGRIVVVYDGNNADTIATLNKVLGNPVVG